MGSPGQSGQQDLGAGWAGMTTGANTPASTAPAATPAAPQWNGQGTSPSFMSNMQQQVPAMSNGLPADSGMNLMNYMAQPVQQPQIVAQSGIDVPPSQRQNYAPAPLQAPGNALTSYQRIQQNPDYNARVPFTQTPDGQGGWVANPNYTGPTGPPVMGSPIPVQPQPAPQAPIAPDQSVFTSGGTQQAAPYQPVMPSPGGVPNQQALSNLHQLWAQSRGYR